MSRAAAVSSDIQLIFICDDTDKIQALYTAVSKNLETRMHSDIEVDISVIEVSDTDDETKLWLELTTVAKHKKLFFLVLKSVTPTFSEHLVKIIDSWQKFSTVYGIYFHSVQSFMYSTLQDFIQSRSWHFPVVASCEEDCADSFCLLLYIIHLSIGENGERKMQSPGKNIFVSVT